MAAIGTTGEKTKGECFFDVWEWGGRPGDATSGSVDKALEAIRNYIINVRDATGPDNSNALNVNPVVIYFRGSTQPWYLQRPFFVEKSYWEIRGAGREQTTVTGRTQKPCFIFGMPRAPKDPYALGYAGTYMTLSADHWVDGYGVLDTSAVTAAGQRWGLRTKNDAVLSFPLTPFSHGTSDGWAMTPQMTIDFCVNPGVGKSLVGGTELFGMGHPDGTLGGARPWYMRVSASNQIDFVFRATGLNQPTGDQTIRFSLGNVTGLMRITFQIDLAAATVQAYVNGTQLAIMSVPATFQAANKMAFVRNNCYPFSIGKRSAAVLFQTSSRVDDLTYFGLSISNALLYQDLGAGVAQQFTSTFSSYALNDYNRYFNINMKNRVACLPLQDPPTGNPNCYNDGRVVGVSGSANAAAHGQTISPCGYFLNASTNGTPVFSQQNRISGMTVSNGSVGFAGYNAPTDRFMRTFGQAIAVGATWEMYITNVHVESAGHGIGSLNAGAVYSVYLDDIIAAGGDAAYYGYYQIVEAKRFRTPGSGVGRTVIRMMASNAKFKDVFIGDNSTRTDAGIYLHGGEYGGNYFFESIGYDNENAGPITAALVCEGCFFEPTTLRIKDFGIGVLAKGAAAIKLMDNYTNAPYTAASATAAPRTVDVDGLVVWGENHDAQIMTDGTLWQGEVRGLQVAYGGYPHLEHVPHVVNTGPGGQGRVVVRLRDYSMPPRSGTWAKNCHVLEMQLPVAGQYATLRCTSSGTYGTATPPVWSGSEAQDDGTNPLAAYIVGSTYISPVMLS